MNLGVKVRFLMLGQTINLALSNLICQLIVCTVQRGLVSVPDPRTRRSGLWYHTLACGGLVPRLNGDVITKCITAQTGWYPISHLRILKIIG